MAKRRSESLTLSPSNTNPSKKKKPFDPTFSPSPTLTHSTPRPPPPSVLSASELALLSQDKLPAYEAVLLQGLNVLVTGESGTGKSYLLKTVVNSLRRKYADQPGAVAVTASTCIAANKINGVPILAWAGIHPDIKDAGLTAMRIRADPHAMARWRSTKVLVIDEINQLDRDTFDALDKLAKTLTNKRTAPLGGIQLVAFGDFFGLRSTALVRFVFESQAWKAAIQSTFVLTEVRRQVDPDLLQLLQDIRLGEIGPPVIEKLKQLSRPLSTDAPIVQLVSGYDYVFWINNDHLIRLDATPFWYDARDSGRAPPEHLPRLLRGMPAPAIVHIKVGAQVILLADLDVKRGLRRGAIGVVEAFEHAPEGPSHQGSVLYYVVRHGVIFDIATDRAISPGGYISHLRSSTHRYPVVRFKTPQSNLRVLIREHKFSMKDQHDITLAERVQVPLELAWAMSVHDCQGETLPRVYVKVNSAFDHGQVYTALSRVPTMAGLQVDKFHRSEFQPHPLLLMWHKALNPPDVSADTKDE